MITVRISGGLGNQMFQYAFGRKLSIKKKENLILDLSSYDNYNLFKFGLNCYDLKCDFINRKLFYNDKYIRKICKQLASFGLNRFFNYYIEKELFKFDKNAILTNANYYLGSWQSFKYFEDITEVIINDFKIDKVLNQKYLELTDQMSLSESISLHIRRGDYFSDKRSQKDHGVLGLDYFERALNFVISHMVNPRVYVFSDDMNWVKNHFKTKYSVHYISDSFSEPEISINLMSKCKHNIIANSSFSWWGAWLNQNPDKIIIAPKIWMRNNHTSPDLVPGEWTLI